MDNLGEVAQLFHNRHNSIRKAHMFTKSAVSSLKSFGTISPFPEKGAESASRSQPRKKSWIVKIKE